jgi:hypothetical protein
MNCSKDDNYRKVVGSYFSKDFAEEIGYEPYLF